MKNLFLAMLDIFKAMPIVLFDLLCIIFPFLEVFKND